MHEGLVFGYTSDPCEDSATGECYEGVSIQSRK
jgi:hypothetical protein